MADIWTQYHLSVRGGSVVPLGSGFRQWENKTYREVSDRPEERLKPIQGDTTAKIKVTAGYVFVGTTRLTFAEAQLTIASTQTDRAIYLKLDSLSAPTTVTLTQAASFPANDGTTFPLCIVTTSSNARITAATVYWYGGDIVWPMPSQNTIYFGKTVGTYSSGTTFSIDPCDAAGTLTGEARTTVNVQLGGASHTMNNGTIVPADTIVPWTFAGANRYVIGKPTLVLTDFGINGSSLQFQVKTKDTWGAFSGTESGWVNKSSGGICT